MERAHRAAAYITKGGTGKTTAIAHLGVACARHGHRVLLVDLAGKQCDLARQFGIWETYKKQVDRDEAWPNIATVFQNEWSAIVDKLGEEAVDQLIWSTEEFVDLIPSHPGLDSVDAELANVDDVHDRYSRLDRFLTEEIDSRNYDVILLDLPGASNNISYSGLWAANHVVVPVDIGRFGVEQVAQVQSDLDQMGDTFDVATDLTMILPNMVSQRTILSDEYLAALQEEYPETIAPTYIVDSQDIRNAVDQGKTVYRVSSPSETAKQARQAFNQCAKELIRRLSSSSHD